MSVMTAIRDAFTPAPDAEARRLASRRSAKERLAEMTLQKQKAGEKVTAMGQCNAAKARAAAECTAICEPLQAELGAIEQRSIGRLVDNLPADEADEKRRQEIGEQISAATEQRDTVITVQGKRLTELARQRDELLKGSGEKTNEENALRTGQYANPRWRDEHFSYGVLAQAMNDFCQGVNEKVRVYQQQLELEQRQRRPGHPEIERAAAMLARWQAVASLAGTTRGRLNSERLELEVRMFNE
jgi:hypothetical protein